MHGLTPQGRIHFSGALEPARSAICGPGWEVFWCGLNPATGCVSSGAFGRDCRAVQGQTLLVLGLEVGILPYVKVICHPVTLAWMQVEDLRLLGQRERTLLLTAKAVSRASFLHLFPVS